MLAAYPRSSPTFATPIAYAIELSTQAILYSQFSE